MRQPFHDPIDPPHGIRRFTLPMPPPLAHCARLADPHRRRLGRVAHEIRRHHQQRRDHILDAVDSGQRSANDGERARNASLYPLR